MNWELEKPNPPLFGRQTIKHNLHPHNDKNISFDDSYDTFNPQSSSQWDGLRHICHLPTSTFYNGIKPDEIVKGVSGRLGVHHMARRGIAGRAVLLDYARWAEKHKPDFNPLVRSEISVDELKQVAEAQNITFKKGDILLVNLYICF